MKFSHNFSDIAQNFSEILFRVSLQYFSEFLWNISQKFSEIFLKISLKFAQFLWNVSQTLFEILFIISFKYFSKLLWKIPPNSSESFSEFLWKFLRISIKFSQNFSEIFLGIFLKVTQNFSETFSEFLWNFSEFWDLGEKMGDSSKALIFDSFFWFFPCSIFCNFSAFSSSLSRYSLILFNLAEFPTEFKQQEYPTKFLSNSENIFTRVSWHNKNLLKNQPHQIRQ